MYVLKYRLVKKVCFILYFNLLNKIICIDLKYFIEELNNICISYFMWLEMLIDIYVLW